MAPLIELIRPHVLEAAETVAEVEVGELGSKAGIARAL
jgi:hypothetical protein